MELSQTESDNVSLGETNEEVMASIDESPAEIAISVRVAVRVRPNPRPVKERSMLQVAPFSISTLPVTTTASGTFGLTGSPVSHPITFHFDEVYHEGHSQAEVYAGSVEPLVNQFLQGYNATLLAYGQTASGKTHTMGTTESQMTGGMIGRSLESIFNHLEETEAWKLRVGYLEIYNEQLVDLLR
ncbi:hypothetical protein DSO57_1031381 [Entomophthora muscae]|uniref:Uncharacterized protein n=1 Tax=Entomophthora muscae TaxID=34485 RepID=A0ACC2TC10_9FUNG|nr:hypothetical protein DSO57_1031381 [Entomophthora muscae]